MSNLNQQLFKIKEKYDMVSIILLYPHVTSICRIQQGLETSLGKVLIKENGCSFLKINNVT